MFIILNFAQRAYQFVCAQIILHEFSLLFGHAAFHGNAPIQSARAAPKRLIFGCGPCWKGVTLPQVRCEVESAFGRKWAEITRKQGLRDENFGAPDEIIGGNVITNILSCRDEDWPDYCVKIIQSVKSKYTQKWKTSYLGLGMWEQLTELPFWWVG